MSDVVLTPDELDDYARPKVEMILVSGRRNTSVTLHLKSADERMEPVCGAHARYGWLDKSLALYPPNYAPFCSDCVEKRFGVEVMNE